MGQKRPISELTYKSRLAQYDADLKDADVQVQSAKAVAKYGIERAAEEYKRQVHKYNLMVANARRDYNRAYAKRQSFLKYHTTKP